MTFNLKRSLSACAYASLLLTSTAWAAGGQILSDITYRNPAGMTRVKCSQFEADYYYIPIDTNSCGGGLYVNTLPPSTLTGKVSSHVNYNIPYVGAITRCGKWAFGIDVSQPFRTKLDYNTNSNGRYAATDVNVLTYEVTPKAAYQVSPQLSVGFGLNIQYIKVILDNVVIGPNGETPFLNDGTHTGVGFNLGATWSPRLGTIFGISYFSKIIHNLDGSSKLVGVTTSNDASTRFDRPWSIHARLFQAFSKTAGAYVGYTYVNWSFLKSISLNGAAIPNLPDINFFYNDSHRVDLGGRFVFGGGKFISAVGVYYMNTPTNTIYRNLNLPEGDRTGVVLRLEYKVTPCFTVKGLYSRAFVSDARINNQSAALLQQTTIKTTADVWGLGIVYST